MKMEGLGLLLLAAIAATNQVADLGSVMVEGTALSKY